MQRKGAVPNEHLCSSHLLCWSHLKDIWHINCVHHVWSLATKNALKISRIGSFDRKYLCHFWPANLWCFLGAYSHPHFKLLLKLPKTIYLMENRGINRPTLFKFSVTVEIQPRGIVWGVTFGWHTIVPAPCLNWGIHLGVQLEQKEIVHHRRKISYQSSSSCIIVQKPQNAASKKQILPRVLRHQDRKYLSLGNYLPLAWTLPKVYKRLRNMVAEEQAFLFHGSISTAPWVTKFEFSSTAPSVNKSRGGQSSQACIARGLESNSVSSASAVACTSSGVTRQFGPEPPNLWRSWQANCVLTPAVDFFFFRPAPLWLSPGRRTLSCWWTN